MSTSTDILEAFGDRLKAFSYSPSVTVIPPGRGMEPPDSGMWLEASFFPNEPQNLTLGFDSTDMSLGFCQVAVGFRKDEGQVKASRLADAVIDWFPKGLEFGPVRIIRRPYQLPAVTEDGSRMLIAVTIPYQGLTCPAAPVYDLTVGSVLYLGIQSYGYGNGTIAPAFGGFQPSTFEGETFPGIALAFNASTPGTLSAFQSALPDTIDVTGKAIRIGIMGQRYDLTPASPFPGFNLMTTALVVPLWLREYLAAQVGETIDLEMRLVDV